MKRIELGVSKDYWDKWKMPEALREFVANALDTHMPVNCRWADGVLTIEDEGIGFDRKCLMLGGGERKRANQIGQFREGMDGGMLVCAREGRSVRIATTGLTVQRAAIEETALGEDGFVLYMDCDERRDHGTLVEVECTEAEVKRMMKYFAILEVEGIERQTTDMDALIWPVRGGKGGIYINGVLAMEGGNQLFNYNLTEQGLRDCGLYNELTYMKSAQNRDRMIVDQHQLRPLIGAILKVLTDPELIEIYLTGWRDNPGAMEYVDLQHRLYSVDSEVQSIWRRCITEVFGDKVCMPPDAGSAHNLWGPRPDWVTTASFHADADETEMLASVKESGWMPIPSDIPDGLKRLLGNFLPSVSEVRAKEAKTPTEAAFEAVHKRSWTDAEKEQVERVVAGICEVFSILPDRFPNVRMYTACYVKPGAAGVYHQGEIWLDRRYVNESMDGRGPLEQFVGTVCHEFAHGSSGESDRTRGFESALTQMLGRAVTQAAFGLEEAVAINEVVDLPLWREVVADETVTWDQIVALFGERGLEVQPNSRTAWKVIRKIESWGFLGVEVRAYKGRKRPKLTFLFNARNGRGTIQSMIVSVAAKNKITVIAHSGERATYDFQCVSSKSEFHVESLTEALGRLD